MEKKINIAELLKDCPQGMELDCIAFDVKVTYQGLSKKIPTHPIIVQTEHGLEFELTQYGQLHNFVGAKCIIYPKGKTTWEGFVPPCKFKDGDIVATTRGSWIGITKGGENNSFIPTYCVIDCNDEFEAYFDRKEQWSFSRLATEEEKQKLFQAIKDNGYKWNEETKTLEELIEPKFHVGDWVVFNNQPEKGSIYQVKDAHNYEYTLQHILGGSIPMPFSRVDMLRLWTIDDAKDGDVLACNEEILLFKSYSVQGFISLYCWYNGRTNNFHSKEVNDTSLTTRNKIYPATKEQRDFLFQKIKEAGYKWVAETKTLEKLVTNKFDITTLVPFESRVLVRDYDNQIWIPTFWGKYLEDDSNCRYLTTNGCYKYCIPCGGNEHLLGTTDDCYDYFKTWK